MATDPAPLARQNAAQIATLAEAMRAFSDWYIPHYCSLMATPPPIRGGETASENPAKLLAPHDYYSEVADQAAEHLALLMDNPAAIRGYLSFVIDMTDMGMQRRLMEHYTV